MQKVGVSEAFLENMEDEIAKKAERYFDEYSDQFDLLEKTPLTKVRKLTPRDYYNVGRMAESFKRVQQIAEATGSVSDLGLLPKVALDVITISYGTNPLSMIASVQPINNSRGIVYFKDVQAGTTFGGLTAGQTLANVDAGVQVVPTGYAGAQTSNESLGNTSTGVLTYAGTLANVPVRKGTAIFAVGGTQLLTTVDNGLGGVFGTNIQVVINYTTGAFTISLVVDPVTLDSSGVLAITATYEQDLESATDIRKLNYELTSKDVLAKVYALKGVNGILKDFAFMQEFGISASDELAQDLVNGINSEIFGDMVRLLVARAVGLTQFDFTTPSGISQIEHFRSFKIKLSRADTTLNSNAGRGTINFMIVGKNLAEVISNQTGWIKLYDGINTAGSHLYGTLDGIPVIRVPLTALLDANKGIMGFRGSNFEAAGVYSPYMPLTVTGLLPNGVNPLSNQRAAASWAAVDTLVDNFITTFEVTNFV